MSGSPLEPGASGHRAAEGLRVAAAQATLRRIATAIAEGGSLGELLEHVTEEGRVLLDADRVEVSLERPTADTAPVDAGRTGPGVDARHGGATIDRRRPRTLIARLRGAHSGNAYVVAEGARSPDADLLIDELAWLAALALARADERARMHTLARTDPLTALLNRRAFEERLGDEVAAAIHFGRPLSLAVLDIDRFKAVNDDFGHAVGDGVLRTVCGALAAQARTRDLIARIGGEEIGWLMPDTDAVEAVAAGERALAAVRELELSVGRVTASCGTALLLPGDRDGIDLFERADRALYAAKAGGRDRLATDARAHAAVA